MSSFTFTGSYSTRSSKCFTRGATGERKLLTKERREHLCRVTGWTKVYKGSLNLDVDPSVVARLCTLRELYFEDPSLIKYPEGKNNWAEIRGGYLYYRGKIDDQEIIIRRAKKRPLPTRVEAYAEVKLRKKFRLKEGDAVIVTVRDAD